jgi:hypothetical protein
LLSHLKDKRFGCRRCKYKFGDLTGTYVGEFYFSLDILTHLTYLFALGVPAYRIRFYVPLNLATIERTFRIFRHSIYNESLQKLKELKKLSGNIEMDEALFGGHSKGKRGSSKPILCQIFRLSFDELPSWERYTTTFVTRTPLTTVFGII